MADPPAPRSARAGSRRAPVSPTKIPTSGRSVMRFAPYVVAGVVALGLLALLRTPAYALWGAALSAPVVCGALAWGGLTYRANLAPEDVLRKLLPATVALTLLCSLGVYFVHLFPGAPRATLALTEQQPTGSVVLPAGEQVWLRVRGSFSPTATGNPDFIVAVSHNGQSETLGGRFRPQAGGPPPEAFNLRALRGSGSYSARLSLLASSLAPPLRVEFFVRPFRWPLVAIAFGTLAILGALVDAMLYRRNQEPSFAATIWVPLGAVFYFQLEPVTEELTRQVGTAAVVGLIAMFGGEIAARLARVVVRK